MPPFERLRHPKVNGKHRNGDRYEIRVKGHLDRRWSSRLPGFDIQPLPTGETALTATFADQAALYGALGVIRDLAIPLTSVRREGEEPQAGADRIGGRRALLRHDVGFPIGFHALHPDPMVNFEMNRWVSLTGEDCLAELTEVAPKLVDFPAYRREYLALAERALARGETLTSAHYLRSAEFFMWADDPAKGPTRRQFVELMREAYAIAPDEVHVVPYSDGKASGALPVYRFDARQKKGTVVVHGGFDSYVEEFFPMAFFFVDAGYDVVLFEGPGQGGALEDAGLPLTPEWEGPVAAVLDHFELDDVSLIGISLGGGLCIRAAAFEPRVRRVVAYDALYDFLDNFLLKMPPVVAALFRRCVASNVAGPVNALMGRAMRTNMGADWLLRQGMHITGTATPFDFLREVRRFTTAAISNKVTQDVLVLCDPDGQGFRQFTPQVAALTNVRSLTTRVFTRAEQASHHCQVGNVGLALRFIVDWLDTQHREAALVGTSVEVEGER
jgi:pimeloyl-ACP methyl ester carboxylesterase